MKKILVVEDETSIARLIAYNLEQAGYCVETAEDGEQACTRVESFRPDLVTLDLLLPLKSGWQVLESIRRHSDVRVRQVPIIVVSALASQRQQQELQHSGVRHCLSKPFSISELCLLVRQQLSPALHKSVRPRYQATPARVVFMLVQRGEALSRRLAPSTP